MRTKNTDNEPKSFSNLVALACALVLPPVTTQAAEPSCTPMEQLKVPTAAYLTTSAITPAIDSSITNLLVADLKNIGKLVYAESGQIAGDLEKLPAAFKLVCPSETAAKLTSITARARALGNIVDQLSYSAGNSGAGNSVMAGPIALDAQTVQRFRSEMLAKYNLLPCRGSSEHNVLIHQEAQGQATFELGRACDKELNQAIVNLGELTYRASMLPQGFPDFYEQRHADVFRSAASFAISVIAIHADITVEEMQEQKEPPKAVPELF